MERLTEKVDEKENSANKYILLGVLADTTKYFQGIDKLGQFEDIEDNLGFDITKICSIKHNQYVYTQFGYAKIKKCHWFEKEFRSFNELLKRLGI